MPLFNEEIRVREFGPSLIEFVDGLPTGSELIFVDDGSTDATASLVEELMEGPGCARVRLLRRPHAGKGAAVASGLRSGTADYAGFCDIDLATPLDDVLRLLHVAMRAPVLAVGSRDLLESEVVRHERWPREALGRGYNRLLQATIAPGIVDTQCGAKVAAREVWSVILPLCHERGFAWDAEAIGVAMACGVPVREVPVQWRHDERTRVRVLRDGLNMVFATRRIWGTVLRARKHHLYAPESPDIFDRPNAVVLTESDPAHWWFRSKAAFVGTAIRRTRRGDRQSDWLLDAGAGSGSVTVGLGWNPDRLAIVEDNQLLATRGRTEHGHLAMRALVDQLPVRDRSASVVCLLDVLQHFADPLPPLLEARRASGPTGLIVITVPARTWLWSATDLKPGHFRGYTRRSLKAQLELAGLRPVVLTHVFSWLLPAVALQRRLKSRSRLRPGLDRDSPLVARIALLLTWLERELIGRIPIPFGTSVLAVATWAAESAPV